MAEKAQRQDRVAAKRKAARKNPLAPRPAASKEPRQTPASLPGTSTPASTDASVEGGGESWLCPVCGRRNLRDRKKCGTCYCDPVKHAAKLQAAADEGNIDQDALEAALAAVAVVTYVPLAALTAERPVVPAGTAVTTAAPKVTATAVTVEPLAREDTPPTRLVEDRMVVPARELASVSKAKAKAAADIEAARAAEAQVYMWGRRSKSLKGGSR